MSSKCAGPEVSAIDVDTPKLVQTVGRIINGIEILSEASRGDEVIDFAVICQNLGKAGIDRFGVGNIREMGCDFGMAVKVSAYMVLMLLEGGRRGSHTFLSRDSPLRNAS